MANELLLLLRICFINLVALTLRSCLAGKLSPSGRSVTGHCPGLEGCNNKVNQIIFPDPIPEIGW